MPRALRDPVLGAALAPLDPAGRVQAAAGRLRQAITLGLIEEGAQLPPEGELAAQLGVSTMTLRETLAILRSEGLLQTRRGRGGGTFVQEVVPGPARGEGLDALRELGDEWGAVAGAAAALAAQRASAAEVQRLSALAGELSAEGDVMDRRRADWRFHMQLAAASQSVRLSRAERAIQGELADRLWVAGDGEGRVTRAAGGHRAVAAAVGAGDAAGARGRAEEHVRAEIAHAVARVVAAPRRPRISGDVLVRLERAVHDVFRRLEETRAAVLARQRARAPLRLRRDDLQRLREHLVGHLDDLVSGTGVIVAPDVVDVPRWLEWYWRSEPGALPRLLTVELDPARPDFYDYEQAEWFAVPRRTRERSITGAYVDFGGTDEHIVTLSLPLVDDEGAFLGVAAADVRVAAFQPLLLERLRAAGDRAAIVDQDGRVILSADPDVLVGERLEASGRRVVRRRGLPWALALAG